MRNNYKFNPKILNPDWVVGFIDGEGCFHVSIPKNKSMKLGYQVSLEFSITQHIRDRELIDELVQFFNCGYVTNDTANKVQYRIRDKKQLSENLFRFLDHHSLLTIKLLDYLDFKKVHEMVGKGFHLTLEGLDEIRAIQSTMNRNRLLKR